MAVLLPEQVPELLATLGCPLQPEMSCPPTELPYATYHYHPYGYADDPARFLDSARAWCRTPTMRASLARSRPTQT